MTDISAVGSNGVLGVERMVADGGGAARQPLSPTPPTETDHVEVSRLSELRARLANLPPIRQSLVDRVRAEIEAGTYDTDKKLDAAIDALLGEAEDFRFLAD